MRIKLHPAVSELLARHIRATPGPARPDQVLEDWASVLTDGPTFAQHSLDPSLFAGLRA